MLRGFAVAVGAFPATFTHARVRCAACRACAATEALVARVRVTPYTVFAMVAAIPSVALTGVISRASYGITLAKWVA